MKTIENNFELIGNTPLIHLKKIEKLFNLKSHIYAKYERVNLTGSIKDRIAKGIVENLLTKKIINKDTTIIAPTTGNTGISLACVCTYLNIKLIIVMPSNMSMERRQMIKALGAKIEIVPKEKGMKGCIEKSNLINKKIKNSYILDQFNDETNIECHYKTTGKEIYKQMDGKVDYFLASFGSGGSICGVAKYLKEKNKKIKVIAIEPSGIALFNKRKDKENLIQGIGEGFVPKNFKKELIDEIITVTNKEAFEFTRLLAKEEGLFVGISSGCNLACCIKYAKKYPNKNIVTLFSDNGERYFSTKGLFE